MKRFILPLFILLILGLPCGLLSQVTWKIPFLISDNHSDILREIGGTKDATDQFDQNIDKLCPPPGISLSAWFEISEFPYFLSSDIRAWNLNALTDIKWKLHVQNVSHTAVTLSWDTSSLPQNGLFFIDAQINMRVTNQIEITGDTTLSITFQPNASWECILKITHKEQSFLRTFGGHALASDEFDDWDKITAPAGMSFYPYFSIPVFPCFLSKDIKRWNWTDTRDVLWELFLKNTSGEMTTISWSPGTLPENGIFLLKCNSGWANMREQSFVTVFQDQKIEILNTNEFRWNIPLNITCEGRHFTRVFGGAPEGTNGYEPELDSLCAPPSMQFYPYFEIADFPNFLKADFRNWISPFSESIQWCLKLANATGKVVQIEWSPNLFPASGHFHILNGQQIIDMRTYDKIFIYENEIIKITYSPGPSIFEKENSIAVQKSALQNIYNYKLYQNFPNPFNPETQIRFQLEDETVAKLIIYNIGGHEIQVLCNQHLVAGSHSFSWNGRNSYGEKVASGVYFYKLVTKNFQEVGKMILLP